MALLSVLFLLLLISTLLLAAFGWVRRDSHESARNIAHQRAFYRGQAALIYAASEFAAKALERNSTCESMDTPFGRVDSRLFGAYLWLRTDQVHAEDTVTLVAAVGIRNDPVESFVYQALEDRHPLVVADEGRISGSVRVGRSGLRAGQWQGRTYQYGLLSHGRIDSLSPPPQPWETDPSAWFERLANLRERPPLREPAVSHEPEAATLSSSGTFPPRPVFDAPTIRSEDPVTVTVRGDLEFTGGLLVDGPIEWIIEGDLVIRDSVQIRGSAFWVEGSTEIGDEVRFSGQLLTEGIVGIGGRSSIESPSLIWINRHPDQISEPSLTVTEQASAHAALIQTVSSLAGPPATATGDLGVVIHSSGDVVLSGYLESSLLLESTWSGELYGKGFWYYEKPTTYVNWLVRGSLRHNPEVDSFAWPFAPSREGTPVFAFAQEL